jgi:hypothetical protein
MFVDFNILNQLGSPSINSNTFANRPAAGQTGRLFVSTDTFEIFRDNGTGWDLIGGPGAGTITGTGTATQVAYFTGSQTIGSSANLFWDNTAGALGINTATPGAELDIHGTGIIVQVNSTSATANSLLAFQRSGSGVWRIGDQYNGGSNFFELHNTVLTNNAIQVTAANNKSTFTALETYASGLATGNQFTYNLTVPNGVNITSPNAVGAVNSYLNLSLGGNTTVPSGARQGLEGNSRISFTGAGTLTMTQGSTVRAFSALSSVYSFAGSAVGTVTHLAGLRICFPDNIGSAINITNNYGLLLNDQTTGSGTVTYTNRWGIYQEGASDLNYFAANMLLGSTTNSGQRLQVTGTALFTGAVTGTGNSSTYTVTAASGVARSKSITSTLVAAANNDFLIGLDITPTFNNGAFINVNNFAARINGILAGVTGYYSTGASANTHFMEIVSTTSTNGYVNFRRTGGSNGPAAYQLYQGIGIFEANTNTGITTVGSNTYQLNFLANNTVAMAVFAATRNVLIQNGGTFTDAGFRLDCNGTARIGSTTNNISFSTTATANFITQSFSASYFVYLFPTNNSFSITASRETYVLQSGGSTKGFRFEANTAYATMFINTAGGGSSDQYVNIGGNRNSQNNTSAILELESTVKGFLPPRMTGAQAEAIGTPAAGLMVYANNGNGVTITTTGWWGYDGATWVKLN